jgi:hypothetical protein
VWLRPHEHEQRRRPDAARHPGSPVGQDQAFQPTLAVAAHDLRREPHVDVGSRLDRVDQVSRHALRQGLAAHDDTHLLCGAGQVHRRLAGRVAAAHHVDALAREARASATEAP